MIMNKWPYDELVRALTALTGAGLPVPPVRESAGVYPPVNIYDDGTTFLVRAELPGVPRGSVEVTAAGNQLTIRGERRLEAASAEASYHRRECDGGQFRRVVTLPQPVDGDAITATLKQGVLDVLLPRVPEQRPRRIAVA